MSLRPTTRSPRKRPVWLVIVGIVVAALVLFGIGFGLSALIRGGSDATVTPSGDETSAGDGCELVIVTPADTLPPAETITLNVYNSTSRSGLASETADQLRARGFLVQSVANDPEQKNLTSVGELRFSPKGRAAAELTAYYIPGIVLVESKKKGKLVDVVLGQQFNGLAPQNDVDVELNQPSESPSGPGCPSPGAPSPVMTDAPATDPAVTPAAQ